MENITVLEIKRKGNDYELVVPKGTTGKQIEMGLAQAFIGISNREKELNEDFKMDTLFRSVQHWARLLCEEEE